MTNSIQNLVFDTKGCYSFLVKYDETYDQLITGDCPTHGPGYILLRCAPDYDYWHTISINTIKEIVYYNPKLPNPTQVYPHLK